MERENKRWEVVEHYQQKLKEREEFSVNNQLQGLKRTANSNGYICNESDSPTIRLLWSTIVTPKDKN